MINLLIVSCRFNMPGSRDHEGQDLMLLAELVRQNQVYPKMQILFIYIAAYFSRPYYNQVKNIYSHKHNPVCVYFCVLFFMLIFLEMK